MQTSFRRRDTLMRAFTLIELLVVISIVAILLSLLLPALGRTRVTTEIAVCTSNQRQVGLMTALYQTDNKLCFPLFLSSAGWLDARVMLVPYGVSNPGSWGVSSNDPAFICPASKGKPTVDWDGDPDMIYGGAYYSDANNTLGFNSHLRPNFDSTSITIDKVTSPSEVFWTIDATSSRFDILYGQYFIQTYRHGGKPEADLAFTGSGNSPSSAGAVAGMADGHAEWVQWAKWRSWQLSGFTPHAPYAWK